MPPFFNGKPVLSSGKSNWEVRLDELKTECDKADRELWPNRFALRSEYNARRASFLASQIEAEKQKSEIEGYAYQVRPSGLLVPVERKDRLPVPSGTLEPRPEAIRMMNEAEAHARTATGAPAMRAQSVARFNGVPYMPSSRDRTHYVQEPDSTPDPVPAYEYPYRRPPVERPESAAERPYAFREPVKDDVGFTPPSNEQKFIQHVGMNSNCNVNVQAKTLGGRTEFGRLQTNLKSYRLFCEKCRATEQVEQAVVERYDPNHPVIKDFCTKHRHTVETALTNDSDGRKFRA